MVKSIQNIISELQFLFPKSEIEINIVTNNEGLNKFKASLSTYARACGGLEVTGITSKGDLIEYTSLKFLNTTICVKEHK